MVSAICFFFFIMFKAKKKINYWYKNLPVIFLLSVMTSLMVNQHMKVELSIVHNTNLPKIWYQMVLLSAHSHNRTINSKLFFGRKWRKKETRNRENCFYLIFTVNKMMTSIRHRNKKYTFYIIYKYLCNQNKCIKLKHLPDRE